MKTRINLAIVMLFFSISWSRSLPRETVCDSRVTTSALKKHLTNWSIDKLSCKNLFELLILELFQFFSLKDLVEMYKIKKGRKQ